MDQSCFHLSIPAIDLALSRHWYEQVLGCRAGRCSDEALILDLGGHQLVLQRHRDELAAPQQGIYPRHFGLIFKRQLHGTPCGCGWNKPGKPLP